MAVIALNRGQREHVQACADRSGAASLPWRIGATRLVEPRRCRGGDGGVAECSSGWQKRSEESPRSTKPWSPRHRRVCCCQRRRSACRRRWASWRPSEARAGACSGLQTPRRRDASSRRTCRPTGTGCWPISASTSSRRLPSHARRRTKRSGGSGRVLTSDSPRSKVTSPSIIQCACIIPTLKRVLPRGCR